MSPSLRIIVDKPQPYYFAGDVLEGRVEFETQTDRAIGEVAIHLFGRAKTKVVRNHGQSTSVYRGRANFFDLKQVLFQDHHTHKANTFSWPFSLTIPAHPTGVREKGNWGRNAGFLSTEGNTAQHPLPPTFFYRHASWPRNWRAFTEYYLRAVVVEPSNSRVFSFGAGDQTIKRIRYRVAVPAPPIADHQLRTRGQDVVIKTLRLLPEHADSELTLKQMTISLFRSSSLPRITFNMRVIVPTLIQLNHPDHIPFYVEIEPDFSNTERTTIKAPAPKISLRSFSISIKSKTHARMHGIFSDAEESRTNEIVLANHSALNHTLPERIDLGQMMNMRVREGQLTPSFNTLQLRMVLECAGETEKFVDSAGTAITIIGSPEGSERDYLGPPEEEPSQSDDEDDLGNNGKSSGGKAAEAAKEKRARRSTSSQKEEFLPQYTP